MNSMVLILTCQYLSKYTKNLLLPGMELGCSNSLSIAVGLEVIACAKRSILAEM